MDLNAALILVRIVDKGSFTAAAQELGMTKATVSRRIAELEQRLGARLLYRSTRQLTLTEAGEQYYLRCSKAVEELAQAELMLSASQQEVTGTLKLAVPIETGQLVVGRLVANFLQAYPGMKVELELTNDAIEAVAELALTRKTGARGLRSIMEAILLTTMFELPGLEDVEEIVVNGEVAESRASPLYIYGERPAEQSSA